VCIPLRCMGSVRIHFGRVPTVGACNPTAGLENDGASLRKTKGGRSPPTAASIPVVRSRGRRIRLGETAVGVSTRSRRPTG
jgi:hypothetical protein